MSSWPEIYDEVFARFRGLKQSGDSWVAFCPAHSDENKRSLAIKVSDKKMMVHCHANHGCTAEKIMDAIGLPMSYLFSDGKRGSDTAKKVRRVVATYQYLDDDGKLVFEVLRYDPKEFRQRRPNPDYDEMKAISDANQPFLWHTKGIRRVLYRQNELVKALKVDPSKIVFVVEGEKAADAIASLGLLATCSSGGAGKWVMSQVEAARVLVNKRVVVIADDDPTDPENGSEPGMDHAVNVSKHLEPLASRVKIMRLTNNRDKSDAFDWIEDRRRKGVLEEDIKDELMRLAKEAMDCVSIASIHPWIRQGIVDGKTEWEIKGEQTMLEFFGELRIAWVGLELKVMSMADSGRFDADARSHVQKVVSVLSRMCRANGGKVVERNIPI